MTTIDIFSDVICPWCFIGKRRLERALEQRPLKDLTIHWRAFQLNPDMPAGGMPRKTYVETKFGGPDRARQIYANIRVMGEREGLDFQFEKIQRTPNTVTAHRLIRHATEQGQADALVERLFSAYFTEGLDIGDEETLLALAGEVGMDTNAASEFLVARGGLAEVMAESRFAYENGISGVPCFIFNRRYAVSGAQEPEAFFPFFDLDEDEELPVAGRS